MKKDVQADGMGRAEFLAFVKERNPHADVELVGRGYDFAGKAHAGQKRLSGQDYFDHVLNVAFILAQLRLDTATICAGLLHDVIEDTPVKAEQVQKAFGDEVLELIEGVTKIRDIHLENLESRDERRAANIRKVLFATLKDIRVMIIKLADRLHNMRTLKYHTPANAKVIAQETLDVYVPIAYKLGMYRLKSELEDLSLRFLGPDVYQDLKEKVAKKKETRDKEIREVIRKVKQLLADKGIEARVQGRAKNFYSIYRKMQKKKLTFEEVRDLYAIRIIVKNADECYRVLHAIHSTWQPINAAFDDYISTPKPNMYQSLHTEVMIDGKTVETQIRTWDMHYIAEDGIAAHWQYKDTERDKKFDRRVAWLKQILEWKTTSKTAKEFIEDLKIDIFKDEIFALTPKGDPIPLPEGATPVDFAYMVHTDIGNRCVRAKVNGNIIPLDSELKSGDVVEIITSKNTQPSRNWLKFVKTTMARSKIRQALNLQRESEGKPSIMRRVNPLALVRGVKESLLKMSKCCSPAEGDDILGYKMKDGKVAVHIKTCNNLKGIDESRLVNLDWESSVERQRKNVRVEIEDRVGLFSDILDVFSNYNVKVDAINTKNTKHHTYVMFEIEDVEKASAILSQLKQIRSVRSVEVES